MLEADELILQNWIGVHFSTILLKRSFVSFDIPVTVLYVGLYPGLHYKQTKAVLALAVRVLSKLDVV